MSVDLCVQLRIKLNKAQQANDASMKISNSCVFLFDLDEIWMKFGMEANNGAKTV